MCYKGQEFVWLFFGGELGFEDVLLPGFLSTAMA